MIKMDDIQYNIEYYKTLQRMELSNLHLKIEMQAWMERIKMQEEINRQWIHGK